MIILITGASHTGKTLLAQKLLESYHYPYLSIDHLKMGLIRSRNTELTPSSSNQQLTDYLWPIVSEMVKTAIENNQNLIVEGSYIPFNWQESFSKEYLDQIRFICLIMSEHYIHNHFDEIKKNASIIEQRIDDNYCTMDFILKENKEFLLFSKENNIHPILIDESYDISKALSLIDL